MLAISVKWGAESQDSAIENNVVVALPLYFSAGVDAFGISEQDDLEQPRWVVGLATTSVIVVLVVER